MASLAARIELLATALRDKINTVTPRLLPNGGTTGQALVKNSATSYDASWQTPTAGASTPAIHNLVPGMTTGSYFTAATNAIAPAVIAGAANRLDFYPLIIASTLSINELAIEVTTAIAASLARVGVYNRTIGGLPNSLLTGAGTELNCATTGLKLSTVAPNLLLQAGELYWLAVLTNSTQTLRGIPLSAMYPLGVPAAATAPFTLRRATQTYASGLPAIAPATTLTTAIAPIVRLRVA